MRAFRKVVKYDEPGSPLRQHAESFLSRMDATVRRNDGVSLDTYLRAAEHFEPAFAAMQRGEWRAARRGFLRVLELHPRHHQSHGNLGICLASLGRREEALAAFDRALEINPEYMLAVQNRAVVEVLAEGERLQDAELASVDYGREEFLKGRG